jgi:DNA-binding protein YbaB
MWESAKKGAEMKYTIIVLTGCLAVPGSAMAQEKKIARTDLPAAVEKTVAAQSKGATIRGFRKEMEKGKTTYEVQMTGNGHTKDLEIDEKGVVIEVEEQVALEALPAEARIGLQAKAGKGRITKVESITKKDRLVAYEAQVDTDGKKSEVQVGADGKPLDHEE